jgi:hypothetical protein
VKRGGYDSYATDEALRQAEERGEDVGWDRFFGTVGSSGERVRLALLTGLVAYWVYQFVTSLAYALPGAVVTALAALVAPRIGNWLVRPFGDSFLRRTLWGLGTAAALLLLVRVVLAGVLVVGLRLNGVAEDQAGVGAFHGAATFTLIIAMPVWILYAIWGWLRRRSLPRDASLPAWRRVLPYVLIGGMMIFLAKEGTYMDELNGTTLGIRPITK